MSTRNIYIHARIIDDSKKCPINDGYTSNGNRGRISLRSPSSKRTMARKFPAVYLLAASSLAAAVDSRHGFPPAVKVLVCTEALCPDCENFVKEQLVPVYSQLGPEVIDLQMIPFGNAHFQTDGSIECQHGQGECDANVYELCAIYMNPDPEKYLPFLACLAATLPMGHHDDPFDPKLFEQCASTVWWSGIEACHDTPSAVRQLIQAAADATPKAHKYVSWIEIEGTHLDEENLDFKTEICKVFVANGGSHPACSDEVLTL